MRIGIFGKTGSGKTYFCKKLLKQVKPDRLLILDYHNEYNYLKIYNIKDLFSEIIYNTFQISFIPQYYEDLEYFKRIAYSLKNLWLVLEEIDFYAVNSVKDSVYNIFNFGRHRGQNVIYLSRRPYNVPRYITANSEYLVIFKTIEPRDLEYFKSFGINPEKIRTLKDYEPFIIKT